MQGNYNRYRLIEIQYVVTLEDSLVVLKVSAIHWHSQCPSCGNPRYWPQRNENIHPHTDLCMDVHDSSTCNSQKLETTKMYFNGWMDKQIMVHSYNRLLSTRQTEEQTIDSWTRWMNLSITVPSERSIKKHSGIMDIYIHIYLHI